MQKKTGAKRRMHFTPAGAPRPGLLFQILGRTERGCGTADWTGTAASQECRRAADARTLRFPDDDFGTGKAYYQLQ